MKILWSRILVASLTIEIVVLLVLNFVVLPLYEPHANTVTFVLFASMLVGGLWVARKAESRFILQGALVGVAAIVIYSVMTIPFVLSGELVFDMRFFVNHIAKILGGAAGGLVAGRMLAVRVRPTS